MNITGSAYVPSILSLILFEKNGIDNLPLWHEKLRLLMLFRCITSSFPAISFL